jgi:hypothetical protein
MDYALEHAKAAVYLYQLAMLQPERKGTLLWYAREQAATARNIKMQDPDGTQGWPYYLLMHYLTHFGPVGTGGPIR